MSCFLKIERRPCGRESLVKMLATARMIQATGRGEADHRTMPVPGALALACLRRSQSAEARGGARISNLEAIFRRAAAPPVPRR